jgi:hypothetical protein
MELTFEQFEATFLANLHRRSRTAHGLADTSTTPGKQALVLAGDELTQQVAKNAQVTARRAWEDGYTLLLTRNVVAAANLFNRLLCAHLEASYSSRQQELSDQLGFTYNPRWRVDTPHYTGVEPLDLPRCMAEFEHAVYRRFCEVRKGRRPLAQLLAYADYRLDGWDHPYTDGCGRTATALVMCLSLTTGQLPVFGEREEHYASLQNLAAHTAYYQRCLDRD